MARSSPANEESLGLRYGCVYWVQRYSHSLYISDLSASGPLKSDSDEWWYLCLAGCIWGVGEGGSGRRSYSWFYLNGRKCVIYCFSCRTWAVGLLVLFNDVYSYLSTYTDV